MTRQRFVRHALLLGLLAGLFVVGGTQAEAQRWGRPNAPRSGACFYRDANFQGDYFCLRAGERIDAVPNDMNDQISSIRTFGGDVEVTIYQNRGFGGRSERFRDVRNLRDEGWNDKLSSLSVVGLSPEGSLNRPSGVGNRGGFGHDVSVERIVHRAYQDILAR
jgi:hypothetical protein